MASSASGAHSVRPHTQSFNANLQTLQTFHHRCGRRITLSNGNRTATRSVRDFSHALVFSSEPLIDDVLFEVVIEKKVIQNNSWGGSIEIGVTAESPDDLELPSSATAMRNGTWIMSGIDVRKDGICLVEFYGSDLENLNENDRVGVLRTGNDELEFFVNGESLGVAARNVPKTLWSIVDLYGQCVQVSLYPSELGASGDYSSSPQLTQQTIQNIDIPMSVDVTVFCSSSPTSYSGPSDFFSSALPSTISTVGSNYNARLSDFNNSLDSHPGAFSVINVLQSGDFSDLDRIRFHTRCGSLVKLSPNCRCAERRRPLDEFNNGVVMTHRSLKDNELFEIRIDKLVDKWSGSIEVGVTTHNPSVLHFPATMTNMRSGTIMMSGCGILTNGKGTRRQYGEFNLDELREGDRVGMMRKSNGNLHYYINGQDQGVAATRVAPTLWGVIDLYGMTIKVTIVDRDEREQMNLVTRRNNYLTAAAAGVCSSPSATGGVSGITHVIVPLTPSLSLNSPESDMLLADAIGAETSANDDRLTFHSLCGSHAAVTQNGRTALRPNAAEDFNNGVVLTRRPLHPNELFQVRLERIVTKWAGSVEMGVTIHSADELDFPFTMTNVRSGTWMMTGNGVMHNGVTVIERYGQNLDRLQVGDRVGVIRKEDGTLHFLVNGADQGPAATNVPERVYGVIDLYGQAAQASIVENSECGTPDTGNSTISNTTLYSDPPLRFNSVHGKNVEILSGGLTAVRTNSLSEFNDAIIFSNRPIKQRELFEVVVENMVRHWSGNIEIGVTSVSPEDIDLSANATDLDAMDTILFCGSMIFYNRKTIRSNIIIDLDSLTTGTRVGIMRNGEYLHYYLDGVDQGAACECTMQTVWAVVDLYGQCSQVSLTLMQPEIRAPYATSENSQSCQATSVLQPALDSRHRWTCMSGKVHMSQNWTMAARGYGLTQGPLSHCLIFSEHPLSVGSPFEIRISTYNPLYSGCFKIGITDLDLADDYVRKNIPFSIERIPANTWHISRNELRCNALIMEYTITSLEWLRVGDRISFELTSANTLSVLINSEETDIKFDQIPKNVYVVVELQGSTIAVQVISEEGPTSPLRPCSLRLQDSLDFGVDPLNKQDSILESIDSETSTFEFSKIHGKSIILSEENRCATRTKSYNHSLVYVTKPLCKGDSISIKVDSINRIWSGTIGVGVVGILPTQDSLEDESLPVSIVHCKRPCWTVTHDYININGEKIPSMYGQIFDEIEIGTVITLVLSQNGVLSVVVNSTNLEELSAGLPNMVYPVFDVYGKCECISIVNSNEAGKGGTPIAEETLALEYDSVQRPENYIAQCEKADLEVHEKESELPQIMQHTKSMEEAPQTLLTSFVAENISDNLLQNTARKTRFIEQNRADANSSASSICCLRESLQQQHNTNLHIQKSQSTQRFQIVSNGTNSSSDVSLGSGMVTLPKHMNKVNESFEETGAVGGAYTDDETFSNGKVSENISTSTAQYNDTTGDTKICSINNISVQRKPSYSNIELGPQFQMNCNTLSTKNHNKDHTESTTALNTFVLTNNENVAEYYVTGLNIQHTKEVMEYITLLRDLDQPCEELVERFQKRLLSLQVDHRILMDVLQTFASIQMSNCVYLQLVKKFRASLVLPSTYFQSVCEPICFCSRCNAVVSQKLVDWVYFKLNIQTVNAADLSKHVFDSGEWLPLYYLTSVDKIRAILDNGHPLPLDACSETWPSTSDQKDNPGTRIQLHVSLNGKHLPFLNQGHTYIQDEVSYRIETAFEVYVRKHALSIASDMNFSEERVTSEVTSDDIGAEHGQEVIFSRPTLAKPSDERTWSTKEAGSCVITALVLKLSKIVGTDNAIDSIT